MAEIIGSENTLKVYERFSGQYLTFPKKLLADDYVHKMLLVEYDGTNAKELAKKYGFTYSWTMKLLKSLKESNIM